MSRKTTKQTEREDPRISLPEGRLINGSLFEMSSYVNEQGKKGDPKYSAEIAFYGGAALDLLDIVEPLLEDAIAEEFGNDEAGNLIVDPEQGRGSIKSPVLDGNALKKRRERKGKVGDAYEHALVIRANTIFNKFGDEGPGGIDVYDEDVNPIEPVNRSQVYNGSYGCAAVTIKTYENNEGEPGVKFYLQAWQKTRDGERLKSMSDNSKLFKPMGRKKGGRASRKG